ncbi:hypothetical protein [Paremcibacter congregatus]|tara:strand:+ start:1314 stop:1454 length:141 start_codon:yes stop_codon:yes gene_type:complete
MAKKLLAHVEIDQFLKNADGLIVLYRAIAVVRHKRLLWIGMPGYCG